MTSILKYIINMFPYMLIAVPIVLCIRFFICSKRKLKINWYHEITLFIFSLFLVGLASQTIIPKFEIGMNGGLSISKNGMGEINLIPFKVLFDTYREVFENGYINYFIINFLGNIIIFIPLGFFIPLLWDITNKKVILIGFCSSLFIELCQLFLARGTDVDDLILNTLGVCVGLVLYRILYKWFGKMKKFKNKRVKTK